MNQLDLTNCDKEPIHIPSSVQPHGLLIAITPEDHLIQMVSTNVASILGLTAEQMIGHSLEAYISCDQLTGLVQQVNETQGRFLSVDPVCVTIKSEVYELDMVAHQYDGLIIFEVEFPIDTEAKPISMSHYQEKIKGAGITGRSERRYAHYGMAQLRQVNAEQELFDDLCIYAQKLAGYDRVMLYRFDTAWNGQVVGEALSDASVVSYRDHYFPASDIPVQARELYRSNLQRLIATATYQPAPLVPTLNPLTQKPLNMSFCVTRSVSPIHLEYLQNMSVDGSASVSILLDGELWGLLAMHHRGPRMVSFELRSLLEEMAEVFINQLKKIEDDSIRGWVSQWDAAQEKMYLEPYQPDTQSLGQMYVGLGLLNYFDTSGAAVYVDGDIHGHGQCPSDSTIASIVHWLNEEQHEHVFVTDRLNAVCPYVNDEVEVAAGLMAICLSPYQGDWLLWFRSEWSRAVVWAGDPEKPMTETQGLALLTPRHSFESYRSEKRGESRPWLSSEIRLAHDIRTTLMTRMLHRTEAISLQRAREVFQSEQRFQQLANVAPTLIWILDHEKGGVFFNEAWEQLSGVDASELAGNGWQQYLASPFDHAFMLKYKDAFEAKEPFQVDFACEVKGGKRTWWLAQARPYEHADDDANGYIIAAVDVTRRRNAEQRLRDNNERLRQSNQELEEFAYIASHDLREPLRKVIQFGERLNEKARPELSGQTLAYLDHMIDASGRMNELVISLLEYSRITMRQTEWSELEVSQIIKHCLQDLEVTLTQCGAQFDIGELPRLMGDHNRLYQLFLNLLTNAAKYRSPDRQLKITISSEVFKKGHHRIKVCDNGVGFDPEHAEKVFGVFQRLHGRSEYPGVGVGLALCRKVATQHGGRIYAEAKAGEGACFILELPHQPPDAPGKL